MTQTVSVVICAYTFDRVAATIAAVESVRRQQPVPEQIIVVVDHNPALHARLSAALPGASVLESTGPRGLSGARNTAVAACATDVIAFLDDDAAARRHWLAGLCAPYADPRVAATGGRALPVWPERAPWMLPPELNWIVGCTYTGQPTTTADVRNVMGCSMSFRTSVLDRVGGFVDGIGRVAAVPLGCEETELCIRIGQDDPDARIVFEPDAVVDHIVGVDRTTLSYVVRRSYGEGVSKAAIGRLVGAGDALSTERAYTRSVLPRAVLRELRAGRFGAALAIVVSVGSACAGYLNGSLASASLGRRRMVARDGAARDGAGRAGRAA